MNIYTLAENVFKKHGCSVRAVVVALKKHGLVREALAFAASELLSVARWKVRTNIAAVVPATTDAATTDADMDTILDRRSAAHWPLWNNKALRDASKEEIIHQIQLHEANIVGNIKACKFLSGVLARLGKAAKVGEALSDQEVQQIYDRVYGVSQKSKRKAA